MRRAGLALAALLALAVAPAAGQSGSQPPTGWDGTNPFRCELQPAGLGATVPHPEADPYCVEFDKRHQNIDQLGVVDFFSKEPARVAAAVPKCFYFQSDHWRGSFVQSDGSTKTYEWDGHYFFDKARGEGGAWVTNFNVNGHTGDPSQTPGIPQEYSKYMGQGTGGVITRNSFKADPNCAAIADAHPESIYVDPTGIRGTAAQSACGSPTGGVTRSNLGPVGLGDTEDQVRALLGSPASVKRGFLHYCVAGAGKFLVGLSADRSGDLGSGEGAARAVALLTTNSGFRFQGIGRGTNIHVVDHAFPHMRHIVRLGTTNFFALNSSVIVGLRGQSVRNVLVVNRAIARSKAKLTDIVRRSQ